MANLDKQSHVISTLNGFTAEKPRPRIGASVKGRRALVDVVILLLGKMRRVADVDTQAIRKKLLDRLDGLFELVDSRGDEDFQGLA